MHKATMEQAGVLVAAFIEFSKPLIAAVNGPCFGIACTTTQLCDIAYCADDAYFAVPFMQLGFCAEGTLRAV